MNVFHYGHQDVVGLECTCRQQPLAHRGPFKEKVWRESAQGAWASCDAMEGVGPRKGFRARWQARSAASERGTPDLDGEGADAWEKIGFDFAETPEAEEPAEARDEGRAQRELEAINEGLRHAVEHVTPEELETYWAVLPSSVRDLVTMDNEVSADLLAYVADTDEDRMDILRQHGCPEQDLVEKATVLEALQLAAEEKAARLRRNRVAKRGAQMAVDMAAKAKAQKQREAGDLLEGNRLALGWRNTPARS